MFVVVVRRFVVVGLFAFLAASCVVSPTKPTDPAPPPVAAPCSVKAWACTNTYGAIAYGRNSASWGMAYNYSSQSAANAQAQAECRSSDCSIVAQWANSCGAIATSRDGAAGWATSTTGELAQAQALLSCER